MDTSGRRASGWVARPESSKGVRALQIVHALRKASWRATPKRPGRMQGGCFFIASFDRVAGAESSKPRHAVQNLGFLRSAPVTLGLFEGFNSWLCFLERLNSLI